MEAEARCPDPSLARYETFHNLAQRAIGRKALQSPQIDHVLSITDQETVIVVALLPGGDRPLGQHVCPFGPPYSVAVDVEVAAGPVRQRDLRAEVLLVLGVSLGMSALYAIVTILGDLTENRPLSQQQATVVASQAPGRPWLDLAFQLLGILSGVVPALLAIFLLGRDGRSAASVGLDRTAGRRDLRWGAGLAALIGIPGLGLYLAAHAMGLSVSVVAESLPPVWWRYPVLLLSAAQNAVLEEVVVVAYLLTRLEALGWRRGRALAASSVLRGSYHLYQGFGGFLGNLVMGLIFGWVFQRTRRVLPLVIAHAVIDAVSFVGYAALAGRVGWLPR